MDYGNENWELVENYFEIKDENNKLLSYKEK